MQIGKFKIEALDIAATDCPLRVTKGRESKTYGVESDAWNLVGHVMDHTVENGKNYLGIQPDMIYRDPEKIVATVFASYPTEFTAEGRICQCLK